MIVPRTPEERYRPALEVARQAWAKVDPREAAWKSGAEWMESGQGDGHAKVSLLGEPHRVAYPSGLVTEANTGAEARPTIALMLLHYLTRSDGSPLAGQWVAFRDVEDARWYEPAFVSGVNARLLKVFGNDERAFRGASQTLGGDPLSFGDASYVFRVLPRLWMSLVFHRGDDEFGPEITVLFDAAAGRHLPAEDLVYLGEYLAGRLIKAKEQISA